MSWPEGPLRLIPATDIMPVLVCRDNNLSPALADLLRLFYGQVETADGLLITGSRYPLIVSAAFPVRPGCWQVSTWSDDGFAARKAFVGSEEVRREARRQLYHLLTRLTGIHFPWGSLTGIRPTLMARDALQGTTDHREAVHRLVNHWQVEPVQAELAVAVAQAEEQLLDQIPADRWLVYLGVPFCPSRCAYCSFITQDALRHLHLVEPYVAGMIREIRQLLPLIRKLPAAVYFGGGTPTSLPDHLLGQLLQAFRETASELAGGDLAGVEFTVEAGRPDTITEASLKQLMAAGVSRLCINPQTFHDKTLQRIGRLHTTKQTLAAYELARCQGFTDINLDLIAGLPGESPADFLASVQKALELAPESITLHALAIKRSSRLQQQKENDRPTAESCQTRPQPEWDQAMQEARSWLKKQDLQPYYLYRQKNVFAGLENVGFAGLGRGSLYNVGMMSDQRRVLGLGCGAASKIISGEKTGRLLNPRQADVYLAALAELISRKQSFLVSGSRSAAQPEALAATEL